MGRDVGDAISLSHPSLAMVTIHCLSRSPRPRGRWGGGYPGARLNYLLAPEVRGRGQKDAHDDEPPRRVRVPVVDTQNKPRVVLPVHAPTTALQHTQSHTIRKRLAKGWPSTRNSPGMKKISMSAKSSKHLSCLYSP